MHPNLADSGGAVLDTDMGVGVDSWLFGERSELSTQAMSLTETRGLGRMQDDIFPMPILTPDRLQRLYPHLSTLPNEVRCSAPREELPVGIASDETAKLLNGRTAMRLRFTYIFLWYCRGVFPQTFSKMYAKKVHFLGECWSNIFK